MEYAIQLLFSLFVCFMAGFWLDRMLGTAPWFSILGMLCGMVLGIGILYKRALLEQEKQKQKQDKKDHSP